MTLETFAALWLTPFVIAFFVVLVPVVFHDWIHYHPNDWGR